jgi:DNA-directed RNA polymerase subunit M/transcription elongation factor TFIIS
MSLVEPKSMDECVYFTNRSTDKGKIKAWVFKENCPECKKGIMGKPRDPKTGKPKIRAKEYVCPECNHIVEKEKYENSLDINIQYTCPKCEHSDELKTSFERKRVQRLNEETGKKQAIETIRFECSKCGEEMDVTKKMK